MASHSFFSSVRGPSFQALKPRQHKPSHRAFSCKMVQIEPSLTLTLKHLAPCGAVLSAEQQAVLDHSIHIKRTEAGLRTLTLWGKFTTRNGKDYLVAEGFNSLYLHDKRVVLEAKYYYSQDGARWVDLLPLDADTAARANKVRTILSGDPSQVYPVEEPNPNAPAAAPAEGEESENKGLVFEITELQRLRAMIDSINTTTGVIPKGALMVDANNRLVVNKLFPGLEYPEKLDSYIHRTTPPNGPSLSADMRGCWSLQHDPFKGVAVLRSLFYPGYFFYYSANDNTWGSIYSGDGIKNDDLVFML